MYDLRPRMDEEITKIDLETIQKAMQNVCVRAREYSTKNGSHLSSVIFKK